MRTTAHRASQAQKISSQYHRSLVGPQTPQAQRSPANQAFPHCRGSLSVLYSLFKSLQLSLMAVLPPMGPRRPGILAVLFIALLCGAQNAQGEAGGAMGDVHDGVCCLPPPRRIAILQTDAHCLCLPTLVLCSRFKRLKVAESKG